VGLGGWVWVGLQLCLTFVEHLVVEKAWKKLKSETCATHCAAYHFEMNAVFFLGIFRPRGCNDQSIFVFSSLFVLIIITRSCRRVGWWVGGWVGSGFGWVWVGLQLCLTFVEHLVVEKP